MTQLRNPILATLAYYDIINFPLTAFEIHKYLINPSRLSLANIPIQDLKLSDIQEELDNLVRLNLINQESSFYFLNGRSGLDGLRIERAKLTDQKWKKFLWAIRWLQAVPYIRGIFASGSMAMDNTDPDSDFDVMIIVRSGRLYTTRLLLLGLTTVLGTRRKPHELVAPDKLCFNHYLTEDSLQIKHTSLYNAQSYAHLKPVLISRDVFDKFFGENRWINKYLFNFQPTYEFFGRNVKRNDFFVFGAKILEKILDTKLGDWIEYRAKTYQQDRIKKNPVTYEGGGRVTFNEHELEFHPNSFEKFLINKYNHAVKKLGIIVPSEEKDSGLSR